MYSVCTPFKQGKFNEDQPIRARHTPFLVMVQRAAHSRGEKLAHATPTTTTTTTVANATTPVQASPEVTVYRDPQAEVAEAKVADESTSPAVASMTRTPASGGTLAAVTEEGEEKQQHAGDMQSHKVQDDVSPVERSAKALDFGGSPARGGGGTRDATPARAAQDTDAGQRQSPLQPSPRGTPIEETTWRIAQEVKRVAEATSPSKKTPAEVLAAAIRPHLAGLVERLMKSATLANKAKFGADTAGPTAGGVANSQSASLSSTTQVSGSESAGAATTASTVVPGVAVAAERAATTTTTTATAPVSSPGPTTAIDLLHQLNAKPRPVSEAQADHTPRISAPVRMRGPAPWRGSMEEIRQARKSSPGRMIGARLARQQQQQRPQRPTTMTRAEAISLLSAGHWFLKKLGNKRAYKPQPRFVWLHHPGGAGGAGTGADNDGTTLGQLCWDKRGKQRAPRRGQFVDLGSIKSTVWHSTATHGLDFVDRDGGDVSKKSLNIKGVSGASGSDEAVNKWSAALGVLGFRVRDRGARNPVCNPRLTSGGRR